jgi:hypothetical protein
MPTWEQVLKRHSIERLKREKMPLDILAELPQLIAKGYEAVPEEDFVRLQWYGLYHDKPTRRGGRASRCASAAGSPLGRSCPTTCGSSSR